MRLAMIEQLADQLVEIAGRAEPRNGHERSVERAVLEHGARQSAAARALQQLGALEIVEHAEGGGDIGLEGKEMQNAFAEGVDRLDLQAAGRLHRAREQPPREGEIG